MIDADVFGNLQVLVGVRICRRERHTGLPILGAADRVENLRTGVAAPAAIEQPSVDVREAVVRVSPGRRRFLSGELLLGVLRAREARGLREADVQRDPVAGDVRVEPVEHPLAVLILVEAEFHERAQEAPALGDSETDGAVDRPGQRIGRPWVSAQEGDQVSRGCEPDPHHLRVLSRVDQLVDVIRVESSLQADARRARSSRELIRRTAVGERPLAARNELFRIVPVDAPGQRGRRVVQRCRLDGRGERVAGERLGGHGCRGRVFLADLAGDGGAILLLRNRHHRHHLPSAAWERVALPPAPEQDEALLLQKAVPGRIRGARPDIQEGGDDLVPAVHDVIDEGVVALCQVDRLEDRERHRVIHVSSDVPRRVLDVLDDPVEGMVRIDLAGDHAVELLVGAGASEGSGAEG